MHPTQSLDRGSKQCKVRLRETHLQRWMLVRQSASCLWKRSFDLNGFSKKLVPCAAVAIFLGVFSPAATMAQKNRVKYQVVINHEEQYSIWPADAKPEKGWKIVGYPCVKYECLEYIAEVWTDMRPLSIERFVDQNLARAKEQGFRVD
jgi:MbtH protein